MRIKLPKDLRGTSFPQVLTIELNDFDVDLFLPSLFFKILGQARPRGKRSNDATNITRYVDALAGHPDMEGFADVVGHRVLNGLVRAALIKAGRVGQAKTGEQILSLVPYTLLTHKPGFPAESRRQRGADTFIYQALLQASGAPKVLTDHVKRVFGHGVTIKEPPELGGSYDGQTPLDTLTRISIAFLDGFNSTAVATNGRDRTKPTPCPALERELGTDLFRYLFTYYDVMPVQALTYYLLALIDLELFTYTLKLVDAVNALVADPSELPPAMRDSAPASPPEIYLDFTGGSGGLSQEMAHACVRRDLEAYQKFLPSLLRLRLLHSSVEALRRNNFRREEVDRAIGADSGALYLQGLLNLQKDPSFSIDLNASARMDETRIRQENQPAGEDDDPMALQWLDALVASEATDIDRVVALLAEAQRKTTLEHFVRWYWGVGGIVQPHGILSGTLRARSTWRYSPSNDLLAVLVQLAAAKQIPFGAQRSKGADLRPLSLRDFLHFLEGRFGILVDRPPQPFSGADYTAAARENAQAMLDRLRQMGIFRDLSDDFTVQRLHPPYAGAVSRLGEN